MPRHNRPYSPGMFFHLTARTQGKCHWFQDDATKSRIVEFIADAAGECDSDVVAYVVMHNHLHVLVRHQADPLGRIMQSLLRRTALLIQRRQDIIGHVFERPFWSKACTDAHMLRTWIRYVHRNPVTAGMCGQPSDYMWSSARSWSRPQGDPECPVRLFIVRELFVDTPGLSVEEQCAHYESYVDGDDRRNATTPLPLAHAETVWQTCAVTPKPCPPSQRIDLRDVVQLEMHRLCPEVTLAELRAYRGIEATRIRHYLIRAGATAGYGGCEIARFLHVSESQVSRVLRRARRDERFGANQ